MNAWNPAGFVLQPANPQHVIHSLLHRLDVSVEHRDVGAHAEQMSGAMNGEVAIAVAFVVADLAANTFGKNLGATSRQRVEAGLAQLDEHSLVAHPVEIGKERDFDRREALEVHVRADRLQATQELLVIVERQLGMEAIDDVDFGERLVRPLPQLVQHLLDAHRVGAPVVGTQPRKRAEQTGRLADVRRLEPQVVIEVGAIAVPAFTLPVRQPSHGEQIGRVEQADTILKRQALAGADLLGDVAEARGRHVDASRGDSR